MADARGSEARSSATMPVALSLEAARWLDELPGTVRPERTAARFPHIANNLCTRWPTPQACISYFDELVLDNRGGRAGFPPLILRVGGPSHPTDHLGRAGAAPSQRSGQVAPKPRSPDPAGRSGQDFRTDRNSRRILSREARDSRIVHGRRGATTIARFAIRH